MMRLLAVLALCPLPAVAQQNLPFSIDRTVTCLEDEGHDGDRLRCVGQAADQCMESNQDGMTTVGMGACLSQELAWWDETLNTTYQQVLTDLRASDAQLLPPLNGQAEALREMQRAWIGYRDARCSFEAALWQGGTGASPAYIGCMLQETGEQALLLSVMGLGG